MSLKKKLGLILVFGLFFTGCSYEDDIIRKYIGSYKNYYDIDGVIKDEIYIQENNLFTFKVPYLVKPGARIKDNFTKTAGMVSFMDDFGELIRIDAINKKHMPNMTNNEILNNVHNLLYTHFYKYSGFESKLLYKKFEMNKTFVIFYLPNGSSTTINDKRVDAIRGSVCFIKDDYLYMITVQSSDTVPQIKEGYNDIPNMIETLKNHFSNFN